MAGILTILLMSIALGVASFGVGQLPLFFSFSSDHSTISLPDDDDSLTSEKFKWLPGARIAYLSTLGTGLLLGAALGIIIPEYVKCFISTSEVEMLKSLQGCRDASIL